MSVPSLEVLNLLMNEVFAAKSSCSTFEVWNWSTESREVTFYINGRLFIINTDHHRVWGTGLPVRLAVLKPNAGRFSSMVGDHMRIPAVIYFCSPVCFSLLLRWV